MKSSAIFAGALGLLFFGSDALACNQEAQIISPITRVEQVDTLSCRVFIDSSSTRFHAASYVCPLELSEIEIEGVEVGVNSNGTCKIGLGSDLNGVVFRKDGVLFLE